jgi:hypothetical protein
MPDEGVTSGDLVFVGANQTLLYRPEKIIEKVGAANNPSGEQQLPIVVHNDLVKYFVKYKARADVDCNGFVPGLNIDFPTREVVIQYIEDFQVWFRPISPGKTVPNYFAVGELGNDRDFTLDKVGEVPGKNQVLPEDLVNTTSNTDDLGCEGTAVQPQHIRSALIRMAVRSEVVDRRLDYRDFDEDTDPSDGLSRLARNTIRPYSAESTAKEKPGAVYKIKTLITEVAMPNLAARSDILWGNN